MSSAAGELAKMAGRCAALGLDLCAWAPVGAYNERLASQPAFLLPDLGDPAHTVVLIGNTRALWPRFLEALRRDRALRVADHPLDGYCARAVERTVSETAAALGVAHLVRHAPDAPPRAVAMQHLAEITGLAQTAPCRLSVHTAHGPWIALRAAVVLALPAPPPRSAPAAPCDGCASRPCLPAFERALAAHTETSDGGSGAQRVASRYGEWLAVRDACPVGRHARYSAPQLDYHYRKDRAALLRILD